MRHNSLARALACALAAGVVGAVVVAAQPATAATTISAAYLLDHLEVGFEHAAGYQRSKFQHWADSDGDGCDARDEVLIAEAQTEPDVGASCALTGGTWRSRYDGLTTGNPTSFDIDHMVPLNEAWQSGAWAWSPDTRKAYANDLDYWASLIAVSAHSNRSKGDREPQDWMPERAAYACTYVKQWVAVKWRWHLKVNTPERSFLTTGLKACGWPRVPKPSRPTITTGSTSSGGGEGGGSSDTVSYAVHPGAYCAEHWSYGHHRHPDALHHDVHRLAVPVALSLRT